LTYGDKKFINSRKRICLEARNLNFFDKITMENEQIVNDFELSNLLKQSNFKNIYNSNRGGGYWLWKPYIIYKHLKKLNEGDILIYSDSGSSIPNNDNTKKKLNKYINIVRNSDKGVLAFRNPFIESVWTKGDIFKYFNCLNNSKIYNTRQFTANIHITKKCPNSMKIYKLWWDTAKNNPYLFDDSPSITKNFPNFKENRHDQSIWSIICKISNVEEEYNFNSIPIIPTRIRN
jgi:hypothetical protein